MAKRKMIGILFFALIAEMDLVIKNMINIFFVSHYLGAEGTAAYEVIMPCVMVASAVVALGFNGVQAICAKDYGAGDFDAFERHKNAGYTWIFRDINDFSIEQAKAFIKKVCDYAETYKETFIGFDDITSYSFSDGKIRLLQILDTVNITAFEPFILYTLKNSNEEQQNVIFAKLECYVMRHYIIGNSTKMGSFLQDAVEMIKGTFDFDTKLQDDLISDFRLERALRYINNTKAKLVLFWTELRRHTRRESDLYNTPLNYAYELEHIMPQKWAAHWNFDTLPILDEDGNPLPTDEATRLRNEAVYEIGNMTLLSSRLNKELQNYCFADKVNGALIGRKQRFGMKTYASLSITKEVINRDPLVWNEDSIHERTKLLTEEIKQIWKV